MRVMVKKERSARMREELNGNIPQKILLGSKSPEVLLEPVQGSQNEAGTLGKVVQLGRLSLSTGAISDVVVETIRLLAWVGPLAPGGPQEGLSWACGEWF